MRFILIANALRNETEFDRLRHDLFSSYDKLARPGEGINLTEIECLFLLTRFDLDEKESILHAYGPSITVWECQQALQ